MRSMFARSEAKHLSDFVCYHFRGIQLAKHTNCNGLRERCGRGEAVQTTPHPARAKSPAETAR